MEKKKKVQHKYCAVKYCGVKCKLDQIRGNVHHFFSLPKDPARRAIWIEKCFPELTDQNVIPQHQLICDEHFEDKMFLNINKKNRLTDFAVPTIFKDHILAKRVSGIQCALIYCKSDYLKDAEEQISFFNFPKDPIRCALWIEKCNPCNLPTTDVTKLRKKYKLCSLHFGLNAFSNFQKNVLFPHAVPTLFEKNICTTNNAGRQGMVEVNSCDDEPTDINDSLQCETPDSCASLSVGSQTLNYLYARTPRDLRSKRELSETNSKIKELKSRISHLSELLSNTNSEKKCLQLWEMYLKALHKSIKYSYLEGKSCKRLNLSIYVLMKLIRNKSFERIIKISKQKTPSKLAQIIAAHNKSAKIKPDMVVQLDGYWLVNSETEINIQYRVEKTSLLCESCVLRCNICKICVHTYKCSCINNVSYSYICKHIHACARRQIITEVQNENQSSPLPCDLVVNNEFFQKPEEMQNNNLKKNNEEIKHKLEMILGMHSRANINEVDQMYIIKQCDNILTTLGKEEDFKKISDSQLAKKRKIEKHARFYSKNKVPTLSSIEGTQTRESLKNSTDFLNISTTPMFDHSYL